MNWTQPIFHIARVHFPVLDSGWNSEGRRIVERFKRVSLTNYRLACYRLDFRLEKTRKRGTLPGSWRGDWSV